MQNSVRNFIALAILLLTSSLAFAQQESPKFHIKLLLDGRFIVTGKEESWLDGSFGKGRYGGDGDDSSALLRLAQSSVLVSTSLTDSFSARAQINIDAEPDRQLDRYRIDVIEAIASYRFTLASSTRLRFRGGIFIPPVSLENTDPGWTSPYSITASSINSWIGEEVRTTGLESSLTWTGIGNEIILRGALFWQNDPAGTLLAWRGWALQDRQTGFNDRLPLPPIPAITPEGLFPRQPLFVEPFREVDDNPGFYTGIDWTARGFEVTALYYDNRADPTLFDGVQYGWNTNFVHAGAHLNLPLNLELIAQFMKGNSVMGINNMVDIDFYSWFLLATLEHDRHRFTIRLDKFGVDDRDQYKVQDNNDEDGWGFLAAWILKTKENHRFAVEYLHIRSDRPARTRSNFSDNSLQASYRILFGK
ncbi:MAG TPA: hypothetical protein VH815_14715 [Acidobacteriota bacterium]